MVFTTIPFLNLSKKVFMRYSSELYLNVKMILGYQSSDTVKKISEASADCWRNGIASFAFSKFLRKKFSKSVKGITNVLFTNYLLSFYILSSS